MDVINCRPKKNKKYYNKRLTKKRLEKKKLDYLVEQVEGKSGENLVIIKKNSFFVGILELVSDSFYKIVRIVLWIVLCIFITVGVNTLLNGQLRQQTMDIFMKVLGG